MHFHKSIFSSLSHAASWAGMGGVLATLGAELDKPYSTACYVLSALFSCIAILIKTPMDRDDQS